MIEHPHSPVLNLRRRVESRKLRDQLLSQRAVFPVVRLPVGELPQLLDDDVERIPAEQGIHHFTVLRFISMPDGNCDTHA